MRALCWTIVVVGLVALWSCAQEEPNWSQRWSEIKLAASYADYCDMEICDQVEQGAEPPCDCWCDYDGDQGDDGSGDDGTCDNGQDDVGGDCSGGGGGGDTGGGSDTGGGGSDTGGGGSDAGGGDDTGGGGEGCTLTQGYWKNHNEFASNRNQARDWPAPYDERDTMCGESLLDILNVAPRGEAWYILAHQFIAARLNAASGASTDGMAGDFDEAEALLLSSCGGISSGDRARAIELSELFDAYNNGLLGPGHCD